MVSFCTWKIYDQNAVFTTVFSFRKSPWFRQETKNTYHLPTKSHLLSETKISSEWQLLQTESSNTWQRGQRGERRILDELSQQENISVPWMAGGSSLPPVHFFPAPHFPKRPFLLLPLREDGQEGLGVGRSSLMCFGGTIHWVTAHLVQDGMLAGSGFQIWSLTQYLRHQIQFKTSPDRTCLPFSWSPFSPVSVECSSSPRGTQIYRKLLHWAAAGANGSSLALTGEHRTFMVIQLLLGKEWRILENWNLFCNVVSFLQ